MRLKDILAVRRFKTHVPHQKITTDTTEFKYYGNRSQGTYGSHRLREERIFQSMSQKGNCHDNSVMENFFGLLKQEIYYGAVYYSFEELKSEIEKFIKYYNEKRIKEKLGWMSPVQYRLSLLVT